MNAMEINNYVVDMYGVLSKKCEYGEAMENLNEYEMIVYIAQELEAEVNNGGFWQFFYNSSGNFSNQLVDAFNEIDASQTAEICQKALTVFGGSVPVDREERQDLMEQLEIEEDNEILCECDEAFYGYAEDLVQLNYEYIMQHKECFPQ
ncbi:MAG: DMP19 family protein [Firmicutes bacterium]|nr:DMP19 family protein [Bacillota bacterium]